MSFQTPILFLVFNRPTTTKISFKVIAAIKPKYLFIAADGPRTTKVGEASLCEEVRTIVSNIDWDCEVKTLFRTQNLGCGKAVSSAITWFFEHVEQGIILEDDCIPDATFFSYCELLLNYYKDNTQIMHIGGNNFHQQLSIAEQDYFFSAYNHIWGWATWRRAWAMYDFDTKFIDTFLAEKKLNYYFNTNSEIKFWTKRLKQIHKHEIDTWDYQWTFSIWNNQGLSIVPNVNLVSNIGFGEDATHTKIESAVLELSNTGICISVFPENIEMNKTYNNFLFKTVYNKSITKKIFAHLNNFLKKLC